MTLALTQFAPDKLGHYVAGTIAALLGLLIAQSPYVVSLMGKPLWALAACAAAAVGREIYNAANGGLFDWHDIGATMLGGAAIAAASGLT